MTIIACEVNEQFATHVPTFTNVPKMLGFVQNEMLDFFGFSNGLLDTQAGVHAGGTRAVAAIDGGGAERIDLRLTSSVFNK